MANKRKYGHRPYLYQPGDTFQTSSGTMTVVDMRRIQRKDQIYRKQYLLQCSKGHQYFVNEAYLKAGRLKTCKRCTHPAIIETDPEFAKWFADPLVPQEKSKYSHEKADFYCQQCGRIAKDKNINTVYQRQYVPCQYCTDGISYPKRYLNALFTQLNIKYERQYIVRFQTDGRKSHYKYDFYDKERSLLIEAHGEQHFLPGTFERVGGYSLEKIRQVDREKQRLAEETLGLRYIYLDCRKSDPDWIRKEVLRKLDMYPLENVDWASVRREANRSLTLQIIELCRQGLTQREIGEMLHLHPGTVCHKLQQAVKDGLYDGITPRKLQAEERKKLKEERKARSQEKKEQSIEKLYVHLPEIKSRGYTFAGETCNGWGKPNEFLCSHCGKIWLTTADSILKGRNYICISPCRKKTQQEFTAQAQELAGDEYSVITEYQTALKPVFIQNGEGRLLQEIQAIRIMCGT